MITSMNFCEKRACIFDLDGTLLDTLDDLADAVNHALAACRLPLRSRQDIRRFLGNGVRSLVTQSAAPMADAHMTERALTLFRAHYLEHSMDKTKPYGGILPLLDALKAHGVRTAIVSNKLQEAVTGLADHFFAGRIDVAIGEREGIRRKPAPDMLLEGLRLLDATPEETLYVGDSEVDYACAQAAGIDCASVLWGFRDEDFMRRHCPGATFFFHPQDLQQALTACH